MKTRPIVWCQVALLLLGSSAAADQSGAALADAFLHRHNAVQAARQLSVAEKASLARVLQTPRRTLDDRVLSGLLKNPVAWRPGPEGRDLLRSIVHSLPEVATVPGVSRSLGHACHPNTSNFRGFGFEAIATAALNRFREPNGTNPHMVRMSADVVGPGGKLLESDGCAVFSGADSRQRLVTMKSVSSENALKRSVHKAMSQLALRNGNERAPRGELGQPGIFMLGYSNPMVLQKAQRADWRAAAQRSGAKLLVLAVNQLTGQVTRLASETPKASMTSISKAQRPLPRPSLQGAGSRSWRQRPRVGRPSGGRPVARGARFR